MSIGFNKKNEDFSIFIFFNVVKEEFIFSLIDFIIKHFYLPLFRFCGFIITHRLSFVKRFLKDFWDSANCIKSQGFGPEILVIMPNRKLGATIVETVEVAPPRQKERAS